MHKAISTFLNILYPKKSFCCICGCEISGVICEVCLGSIRHINGRMCFKCGKSLNDSYQEGYCPNCYTVPYYFDRAYSCFEYEGTGKELIHKMKYEGKPELGRLLARFMHQRLRHEDIQAEAIIPVPIHPNKYSKRGFNQAYIIAQHLREYIKLPVLDCIKRVKETKEQYNLDKYQRSINVIDAFSIEMLYNINKYNNVLLLDDIYTTGSTVNECSRILKNHGVKAVYVITAATGSNT